MSNTIIKNFEMYFPSAFRDMADCHESGYEELTVLLKNGDIVLFDNCERTLRKLPKNSTKMTETECRREFGYRLFKILQQKQITQAELSAMAGLYPAQVSNYISGKNTPSFYAVDKIAKALNCSIDEFRYM